MATTQTGKHIPTLAFYRKPCPRKPRGWNVVPLIFTGACTRAVLPDWTRADHREAEEFHRRRQVATQRAWYAAVAKAENKFGNQGPLISAGLRDHWPRPVKDVIRKLAHAVTTHSAAVRLHEKAR